MEIWKVMICSWLSLSQIKLRAHFCSCTYWSTPLLSAHLGCIPMGLHKYIRRLFLKSLFSMVPGFRIGMHLEVEDGKCSQVLHVLSFLAIFLSNCKTEAQNTSKQCILLKLKYFLPKGIQQNSTLRRNSCI